MAQSSTYFRIDEDVLLEFIYHDQANPTLYDIEVDDNGSEIKVLDTVDGDAFSKRHLIHELGGDVVNFDVTYSSGYLAIENFAARKLMLQVGKTYKFNLGDGTGSYVPTAANFKISGALGIASYSVVNGNTILTYIPTELGSVEYYYDDSTFLLKGGTINVSEKANPLFATPDEDTGNDINQLRGRFHAVKVPSESTKWALLGYDSTGAYETFNYINNDSEWIGGNETDLNNSQSAAFTAINFIRYDKIRLHFRSGYNFASRGYGGFLFQVLTDRVGGVQNNLTQLVYLNQSNYEISNPKPFVLGETLFAKFIEIKIPTVLANQNPEFNDFFYGDGTTGSSDLDPTSNYGIKFSLIDRISTESGFDYIHLGEENAFTISREDEYQDFTVVIEDANDGDYFKIYGERDGSASAFEAYILNRINTSSDDIIVLYEVETYEQIGLSQVKTFDTTFTQAEDFDAPILYRPVIMNSSVAVNFSIDVTMRIYNETDNTQIVKRASLTVNQAAKYGKNLGSVKISGNNSTTEVFNTLPNLSQNRSIRDAIEATIPRTTKKVKTFIERFNVVATSNPAEASISSIDQLNEISERFFSSPNFVTSDQLQIGIYPMASYFKFKIARKNGDDYEFIDFSSVENMTLNFVDGKVRKRFNHIQNKDIDMSAGEILFKIDAGNVTEIRSMATRTFYIGLDNGSEETAVIKGRFTVE
jgi:hypothetical protein